MKRRSEGRIDADGYRIVRAPDGHPLAREDGTIREHRLVLFDAIGPGEHPCHWCGWPVSWAITYRPGGTREERWEALIVDHLNGDRSCNDPSNLVAADPWCNSNRGGMAKAGAQPSDFAGVPPWERPVFGNTPAQTRRRRLPAPGRVTVPDVPDDGGDGGGTAAEYAADERPVREPAPSRPPRRTGAWRWAAAALAAPVAGLWGRWWAVVAVVAWWLLVAPPVRVRRRRPAVPARRPFRSWDDIRGELDDSAPGPSPARTRAGRAVVPPPLEDELDELPELGDEPVIEDDAAEGVVVPMRGPTGRPVGPPPPPRRRR